MANQSAENINLTQLGAIEVLQVFKTPWLLGIAVSAVCLILQLLVLILIPNARKYDEKVLVQLTIARIVNTVCEFLISFENLEQGLFNDVVYGLYFQSDFALVSWMFIFTKNLYDKVVLVFVYEKIRLRIVSCLVWFLTLPVGVLCPVLLTYYKEYWNIFYKSYSQVKFFMLLLNALIFVEIFHVACKIGVDRTKNVKHLVKTSVIAFILVCITSAQVLITDLLSYFIVGHEDIIYTFCVVNSFQTFAITIIFIILAGKKLKTDSIVVVILFELKKLLSTS
ncbi:uncharacterized protein LOC134796397 [Cydia splendana]|uniref:uncharacterized protein LOC134796397 n=1 Tax=Cydia splendana TaxID=1100963 RepID=UPI00300D4E30